LVECETSEEFVSFTDSAAPGMVAICLANNAALSVTETSAALDAAAIGSFINILSPIDALAFAKEMKARRKLE
jgi:hypothetical protein